MTHLLIILTFLVSGSVWSQTTDNYARRIEKLRGKGKLTTKSSIDKTSGGSLTAYYYKGTLVLINSLTDAEAAGTETLYFIENGTVRGVFVLAATFDSNDEWPEYYSKHKSVANCYKCHGKQNCILIEIAFGDKPTIVVTEDKSKKELTEDDKEKLLLDIKRTFDQLSILVKHLE